MATYAHSTRTPLLPQSGNPRPLLGQGSGRQLGPVTQAIRAMRAADPADLAIAAIQDGLNRFFAETGIPVTAAELRRRIEDRIEADLALLDALDPDPEAEPSLGASEPFTVGPALDWVYGSGDDREEDAGDDREHENEHGGDIQDEPHDEEPDLEPSLCGLTVNAAIFAGDPWPGSDREAGDDNGIADWAGEAEQNQRFLAMGGNLNAYARRFA
ncbi:hypothetical protein MKK67_06720 [Methylobacterium sp. J-072]|uniref:hypothetical protein n=1 Tax=Methylobacterium sp. J-072 TaxID=2836651 RepID=UPI001FBB6325|nr:hypothetical protein [Methylobacterium sp. J-072]MCJ2092189.1 hypothetical protein [Methylobacterium sp. J-072]